MALRPSVSEAGLEALKALARDANAKRFEAETRIGQFARLVGLAEREILETLRQDDQGASPFLPVARRRVLELRAKELGAALDAYVDTDRPLELIDVNDPERGIVAFLKAKGTQ